MIDNIVKHIGQDNKEIMPIFSVLRMHGIFRCIRYKNIVVYICDKLYVCLIVRSTCYCRGNSVVCFKSCNELRSFNLVNNEVRLS